MDDKTLLILYQEGLSYTDIANRTNSTAKTVQQRIRALKKQPKKAEPPLSVEEVKALRSKIRKLRKRGLKMTAIGRQVGITAHQVYRHLQAIGLE